MAKVCLCDRYGTCKYDNFLPEWLIIMIRNLNHQKNLCIATAWNLNSAKIQCWSWKNSIIFIFQGGTNFKLKIAISFKPKCHIADMAVVPICYILFRFCFDIFSLIRLCVCVYYAKPLLRIFSKIVFSDVTTSPQYSTTITMTDDSILNHLERANDTIIRPKYIDNK